jgi:hypothetical protein
MAALAASSDSTSTHVPSVPQLLVSSSYFDEKGDLSVASLQIPLVFTNFPHDVQSRYEAFVLDICEAHGIATTTSLGSIDGTNRSVSKTTGAATSHSPGKLIFTAQGGTNPHRFTFQCCFPATSRGLDSF